MIECAGNGRVFLVPKEEGAQWQSGAAGNAEFTGVPLLKSGTMQPAEAK